MLETILGILITIVLVAIAIIISKLWPTLQAVVPKGAMDLLNTLADNFVRWADKEYADSPGSKRYEVVLEMLQEKLLNVFNIRIDTEIIKAAIEAAWNRMNLEQISAGLKEV